MLYIKINYDSLHVFMTKCADILSKSYGTNSLFKQLQWTALEEDISLHRHSPASWLQHLVGFLCVSYITKRDIKTTCTLIVDLKMLHVKMLLCNFTCRQFRSSPLDCWYVRPPCCTCLATMSIETKHYLLIEVPVTVIPKVTNILISVLW